MDRSGLERTLSVEVGLRLYFGLSAGYLMSIGLDIPSPVAFFYLYISSPHASIRGYLA